MANFGTYFLKNFSPNFANTFNTSYRYGLSQQEEERQRREQLKAQQEQQGILSQLMTGTKPTLSYAGKYAPLLQQDVPLNDNQKFGLYSKLTPQNQNAYEYWQKQNEPKKVEYEEWNGNKYLKNPDGSVDFTKPVTKKEIKPDFVETNYVGNRQVRREFYKQDDGTVESVDIPTGFFKETRVEKTDAQGKLYQDLGTDYKKELNQRVDRFLTAQDILAATEKSYKGQGIPYIDPLTGIKYTIDKNTAQGMVESGRNQLQNYLNKQGSAKNENYWKQVNIESWDAIQKEGKGDHGVTTWKSIEEDYANGVIEQADFLEARYRFIAKWGYDPVTKIGQNK